MTAKPLISENELNEIKELQKTEKEAYVMATHKNYSPWVLGYSNKKTIAPGLFEHNQHGVEGWNKFWSSSIYGEAKEFLDAYPKPLYIHVGSVRQGMNVTKFEDNCFETFIENKIWKVKC